MFVVQAPATEAELMQRAQGLSGMSLRQIANALGIATPPSLRRAKGWVGQLLEQFLGSSAGSRSAPDFPHLGIEL